MNEHDYLQKEAEYLRAAILTLIDKIEELERYALLTTGAIWSWAVTNSQNPSVRFLLWAPFVIQSLFAFRALVKWKHLKLHMEYLAKLESQMELKSAMGIGSFILQKWGNLARRTGATFWISLSLITVLVNLFIPVLNVGK
jgi:hypothetical protein